LNRLRPLLLALAAIAVIAAFFFFTRSPAPLPAPDRPDIVLITIDTLRADRVGRGLTPAVDALAARGRTFVNARAVAPLTLPSHVSIMTGALPPVHGVRDNGVLFGGTPPPAARLLRDAGYRTGAFVGAYVLDRRFGLADGFETYDDRVRRDPDAAARLEADRRAEVVVDAALAWLARTPSPRFLWVHVYDPHAPYDPPAEYLRRGGSPYDGEVAYSDAQVARLIDALRAAGRLDSTVVAIAGDHGEGLGEHGEATHGMLAYDSTLRVPIVIAGPGVDPGEVREPVSLADLGPSLVRRAGLAPDPGASMVDLLKPLRAERDVYAESIYPRAAGWHAISVLAGERWKLIRTAETELYDVVADPAESRNLAADHPQIVQGMQVEAARLASQAPAGRPAISGEAAERLRALGYVSGASQAAADPSAPNPARTIDAWTTFERALGLLNDGRPNEALAPLRGLVRDHPKGLVFRTTMARALQDAGDAAGAVEVYKEAVAAWPADAALFHDLAVAARAAGDVAEALRAEKAALALDPNSPAALNGVGLLHADAGRPADAAAAFEAAAKADPSNASYWANLGNARRELHDLSGAESAYRRALEQHSSHPDAANGLGVVLVQQRRPADAIAWFERALQGAPDFHEARLNLGIAYQESGQKGKAAEAYRDVLANAPKAATRERQAAAALLKSLGQ
jgi:arylsulfatase A-like enzyme/Tfp pilus assembly protein PilF